MAHAQKPDFVFRRKGQVHLNRRGRQFSRLLAAELCASAVVMLDTPCSEVAWRVLATHSIRHFPLHFPSRASPCAITFQLDSTTWHILEATELLPVTIGCKCFSMSARTGKLPAFAQTCIASYGYVYRRRRRKINMGSGEKTSFKKKNWKNTSDRTLKEKLWYEVYESVVTNCSELPAEQKSERGMLIFLVIVLGIMPIILMYWAEAYTL